MRFHRHPLQTTLPALVFAGTWLALARADEPKADPPKSSISKEQFEKEQAAVRAIEKLGANAYYDYQVDDELEPRRKPGPKPTYPTVALVACDRYAGCRVKDADLAQLEPLTNLRGLVTRGLPIGDAGQAHVAKLKQLEGLVILSDGKVTDEGLVHLKGLTKLKRLELVGCPIRGAGLAHLKGLTGLKELSLARSCLGILDSDAGGRELSEGLAHLRSLPKFAVLDLALSHVTDAGLAQIGQFANLERLVLVETKVTDAGLAHLKGLAKLKDLKVGLTQVGDAGLVHLQALPLERFGVSDRVTDAGLARVSQLSKLTSLNLAFNKNITDEGIAHLKKLPRLKELFLEELALPMPA